MQLLEATVDFSLCETNGAEWSSYTYSLFLSRQSLLIRTLITQTTLLFWICETRSLQLSSLLLAVCKTDSSFLLDCAGVVIITAAVVVSVCVGHYSHTANQYVCIESVFSCKCGWNARVRVSMVTVALQRGPLTTHRSKELFVVKLFEILSELLQHHIWVSLVFLQAKEWVKLTSLQPVLGFSLQTTQCLIIGSLLFLFYLRRVYLYLFVFPFS